MTPPSRMDNGLNERALELLVKYASAVELPRRELPGRSTGRSTMTTVTWESLSSEQPHTLNELMAVGRALSSAGVLEPEEVAEELDETLGRLRVARQNRAIERSRLQTRPRVLPLAMIVQPSEERSASLGVLRTDGLQSEIETRLLGSGRIDHRPYHSLRFITNKGTSHRIEVPPARVQRSAEARAAGRS